MNKQKIVISACGTYLPKEIIKSKQILEEIGTERLYDINTDWMGQAMGIVERRYAALDQLPSDLAVRAAEDAFNNLPVNFIDEIDIVIYGGMERDHTEPATAHHVANKLGINASHVFDISNACFGFIDGMEVASCLIQTGVARRALIVTGEKQRELHGSIIRQMSKGVNIESARNMLGFLSLGDAGGAVVLSKGEPGSKSGFEAFNRNVDSSLVDLCYYHPRSDGEIAAQMRMSRIVALGFTLHREILDQTLSLAGWNGVDWLLSHQTGKRSFQVISEMQIAAPERCLRTYQKLGNVTSTTFPVSFKKLVSGAVKSGDRIGGFFSGSGLSAGQLAYTF